jgi:hypothetical protein
MRRLSWNGHCEFAIVTSRRRLIYCAVSLIAFTALVYVVRRRRAPRGYGSNTNASDAMDLPFIAPDASPEEVLDVAVEYTFPASDPIAIEDAYRKRGQSNFPIGAEPHEKRLPEGSRSSAPEKLTS